MQTAHCTIFIVCVCFVCLFACFCFRERGQEKVERDRNIDWLLLHTLYWKLSSQTPACALTWNQTSDLLVTGSMLNHRATLAGLILYLYTNARWHIKI